MSPITRLQKGSVPSLLEADFGNRIVDLCNAVINAQVKPQASGKFTIGERDMILDLSPLQAANQAQAINDLQNQIDGVSGLVSAIIAALNAASITAVCNGDATITVTLTIPNLP